MNQVVAQKARELLTAIMLRQQQQFPTTLLEPSVMPNELAGLNLMFIKATFILKPELSRGMAITSPNPVFKFIGEDLVNSILEDNVEAGEAIFTRFSNWVKERFPTDNVPEVGLKEACSIALIEYSQVIREINQG